MSKNENLHNPENPQTSYEPIPELLDAETVMRQMAKDFVQAFQNDPNKDVVVPLNGGIVPLYFVIEYLLSHHPELLKTLKSKIIFAQSITENKKRFAAILFSREPNINNPAYMIDDIADTLTLTKSLCDIYTQGVEVHAPVQKTITQEHLMSHENQLTIHTPVIVENNWIASSAGMDEGVKDDYLSTLQRFARAGFFKGDNNTMTVQQKIEFFENLLLTGFNTEDDLFQTCMKMESCKKIRLFSDQMIMSGQLIDQISRHISERS
jgi:hypothetical protein